MRHEYAMRTTVVLPDHLFTEAKKLAAERRTSFTRLLEESLRAYLARERSRVATATPERLPVVRKARPLQDVDLTNTSHLLEIE